MHLDHDTRVGAYVLVARDGAILLTRLHVRGARHWTLPGGGLEVGEDPLRAAVREAWEETGYTVEASGLLTTHSEHLPAGTAGPRPLHSLRLVYRAAITGGTLRDEPDGTTDAARWIALADVTALARLPLVDAAIEAWRRSGPARRDAPPSTS